MSRGTVVRALEIVTNEGLAQRKQGLGTFVTQRALHRQPGFLLSFTDTVVAQGRSPGQQLLGLRWLDRSEALQFGCTEPALELSRLRFVDDTPWALHRSLIPRSVASQISILENGEENDELRARTFSLYESLQDSGFVVDSAEEMLKAKVAIASEARHLNIKRGAPLMSVYRRSFDMDSTLIELTEASYIGNLYSYDARLVRSAGVSELT